ncbi:MAG: class I SAM-dependent methyltransferase [Candidatus Competibacteraceae bacterium]
MIEAFQPIRYFALATNLYHLVDTGLLDDLLEQGPCSIPALAERHGFDPQRLEEFLKYLRNEGFISQTGALFGLSTKGRAFRHYHPIYTFLIGGYAETFLQIGEKLKKNSGWATRNWTKVSIGSSSNARYDTPPILRKLLAHVPEPRFRLLDIGCGNGSYLVDLCEAMPEIEYAYGVEPSQESCEAARTLVRAKNLQDRIQIIPRSTAEFLRSNADYAPNLLILGYILHELLPHEGREGIKQFITQFIDRFPNLNLIVMEIDDQRDAPEFLQHDYGLAFYNLYFLLHGFIDQRVMPAIFWETLFAECGLEIRAKESIDSTGWLPCYLLHRKSS